MHSILKDPSTRLSALQLFQDLVSVNLKKSQLHVSGGKGVGLYIHYREEWKMSQ